MAGLINKASMQPPGDEEEPVEEAAAVEKEEAPVPTEEDTPEAKGPEAAASEGDATADLQQIEQQVTEEVKKREPGLLTAVEKIVSAGMKVMVSPQMRDMVVKQFANATPEQMPQKIAQSIASLITILQQQSKGPMPQGAIVPAAVILMCRAIEMLGQAGRYPVTKETIAQTTQELLAYLMQKAGIKPGAEQGAPIGAAAGPGELRPGPGQGPTQAGMGGQGAAPQPPGGLVAQQMGAQ